VEESLVDKFNTVAGIVPILTTHVREVGIHAQAHVKTTEIEEMFFLLMKPI